MHTAELIFHALVLIPAAAAAVALRRRPDGGRAVRALVGLALLGLIAILSIRAAFGLRWQVPIRLAAEMIFGWGPLCLGGVAVLLTGRARWIAAGLAGLLLAVAVDAFLIEPHAMQVNTVKIQSERLSQPLRIALISDLQTAHITDYEAAALRAVAAAKPDLVLWSGDYLQVPAEDFDAESAAFRKIILDAEMNPPLGSFAVEGDVDTPTRWVESFVGTPVHTVTAITTFDLGPLVVTLLPPDDSRATALELPHTDKLHVVVGHAPDYALAQPDAQILLAGHTHGGQVALPWIGPLRTLSAVPRSQASGHSKLDWGADLIVSRGIGMERAWAPPLRFYCRPEVVIVEVAR